LPSYKVAIGPASDRSMMLTNASSGSHSRALLLWLITVALLIFAMVLVGGATRLTESGLSIVEWKPLTGTIPPLSETAWQAEFEKYQTIPQYQQVNRGMTLDEFKLIYWWEWAHRLLGRVIGAAFLIPFLWFLWKGWVEPALRGWLWAIFGLGALQGAVGWWMVASGLAERVNVSPYRLAFHLTLACAIFALIVWTIERLRPKAPSPAPMRLRVSAIALLMLALCQIYWGALVAGLRAGLLYNTWPLIDGHVVPVVASLFFSEPWWLNLFENPLTVQFTHRAIAYLLFVAALLHAADAARAGRGALALALAGAVTIQAALGIATLVHQVPIGLALAHQGMAVVVLAIAVMHAERLMPRRSVAPTAAPVARAAAK
jgi:cytochrome c oxidase assembly protein subunit 15